MRAKFLKLALGLVLFSEVLVSAIAPRVAMADTPATPKINVPVIASGDTYVRYGSNIDKNYGAETGLYVKQGGSPEYARTGLVKFDLDTLELSANETITEARIDLYVKDFFYTSAPGEHVSSTVAVYAAYDNNWGEQSVTGATAPSSGDELAFESIDLDKKLSWVSFDVTEYVSSALDAQSIFSFVLADKDTTDNTVIFSSRENATNQPVLYISTTVPSGQSEFYVATDGQASNDGTLESPFATLEQARDAIRAMKAGAGLPEGGVTVYLREGSYSLSESFELTSADSGEPGKPIVYKSYPGETAQIRGGYSIDTGLFEQVADAAILDRLPQESRGQVLQVQLGQLGMTNYGELANFGHGLNYFPSGVPQFSPPELFFNGDAMTLARWPNESEGYTTVHSVINPGTVVRSIEQGNTTIPYEQWQGFTIGYTGDRPARWTAANDIWMYGFWYWDWSDQSVRVASIDSVNKRITTVQPSAYSVRPNQRYYVFNLLEEIDVPGEYYLDRNSGILYLYPPDNMTGAEIELSTASEDLISVQGAAHIRFEDLYVGTGRKNAFEIVNSQHITLDGLTMAKLGNKAVMVSGGSDVSVLNSDITGTGAGGIVLNGGDRISLTPGRHLAENNHIYAFSRTAKTYSPAIQLTGVGNRAAHNMIHDGPHVGLMFTGNDHVVEYNEIFDVVKEADDMGAIYTGRDWTFRGNVIRYNLIHHVQGIEGHAGAMGVYLDDAMSSAHVYGNIIYRTGRAIMAGGGRDHLIENNLLIDNELAITIDDRAFSKPSWFLAPFEELQQKLNQVPYQQEPWSSRYPKLADIYGIENNPGIPAGNVIRRNAFIQTGQMSLAAKVTQYGTIENNLTLSSLANAGFEDHTRMDFRLREDSAVLAGINGFETIPLAEIGLYAGEGRVQLPSPGTFTLQEPEFDAAGVTLAWKRAPLAHLYKVTIAEDENFQNVAAELETRETRLQPTLEPETTYYWKVQAILGSDYAGAVWNSGGAGTFETPEADEEPADPSIATIPAAEDAYVMYGGNAALNYGSETVLEVKKGTAVNYNRTSLVKFDLGNLDLQADEEIEHAQLKLYVGNFYYTSATTVKVPSAVTAYAMADNSWNELTVTGSTIPALGAELDTVLIDQANQWVTFDVTEYLQAAIVSGEQISFGLSDRDSTDNRVIFNSSEHAENQPVLVIQTARKEGPEEKIQLDEILTDADGWNYDAGQADFSNAGQVAINGGRVVAGYSGAAYENETLVFRTQMTLEPGTWQGFSLRSAHTQLPAWSQNRQYLLVVKDQVIELQRWNPGQKFLVSMENNVIRSGEWHQIEFGVRTLGDTAVIVLRVDDEEVFSYIDEQPLTGAGYFTAYNFNTDPADVLRLGPVAQLPAAASVALTGPQNVAANQEFDVILEMNTVAQSVYAHDVTFHYDPLQVEFVSAESLKPGLSILEQSATSGQVRLVTVDLQAGQTLPGTVNLLKVRFKAKEVEQTETGSIYLSDVVLADGAGVEDSLTEPVSYSFELAGVLSGDLNGDGKFGVGDLALLATVYYGKTHTDPNWNQYKKADLNNDKQIDIQDLYALASRIIFG